MIVSNFRTYVLLPVLFVGVVSSAMGQKNPNAPKIVELMASHHLLTGSELSELTTAAEQDELTVTNLLRPCPVACVFPYVTGQKLEADEMKRRIEAMAATTPALNGVKVMVTPKSGVFLSPDKSFNHLVSVSLNGVEHTDYVIDETQTVALLNNLLIDQKSPYRLFFVWPGQQKAWWGAPEGYGVIALIVEHTKELGPYLDFWRIVGARPNPAITAQHRTNGLKSLEEAGLFSGLEAEQLTIAKKAAAAEPYASFNEMLGCFPNTVVPIRPEALADVEQPYAQLLEQLQAASRGVLEISEVDDRYRQATANAASVHYAFRLGKKRITGKHTADRVMIWTLIDQINEELKRSRQDGRFYPLFVPRPWELDGVNSAYIFLTAKQHQTITEAGWLSFDAERAKLITAEEIEGYEVETRASWTRFHRD